MVSMDIYGFHECLERRRGFCIATKAWVARLDERSKATGRVPARLPALFEASFVSRGGWRDNLAHRGKTRMHWLWRTGSGAVRLHCTPDCQIEKGRVGGGAGWQWWERYNKYIVKIPCQINNKICHILIIFLLCFHFLRWSVLYSYSILYWWFP